MKARVVVSLVVGLWGGLTGCSGSGGNGGSGGSGGSGTPGGSGGTGGAAARFMLTSPAFENSQPIPPNYTCAGDDLSPPFDWTAGPAGTMSYALLLTDLEPTIPVIQWAIWDISGGTRSLAGGQPESWNSPTPLTNQVSIDVDNRGYKGPCPNGVKHKYLFRLYAIERASLPDVTLDSTVREVADVILDHLLDFADLYGTSDATSP